MNIYSMLNCSSLLFLYSKSNKKYASLFHGEIYLVIACPSIITGGKSPGGKLRGGNFGGKLPGGKSPGGNLRGGNLRGGNHLDPVLHTNDTAKKHNCFLCKSQDSRYQNVTNVSLLTLAVLHTNLAYICEKNSQITKNLATDD